MATPDREAVLDDIAKTIRGISKVALIMGSESGVMVKAHEPSPSPMVFVESHHWPAHPDITESFALEIRGRKWWLSSVHAAGKQANVNQDNMRERVWEPLTQFELKDKCLTATREKRSYLLVGNLDFEVTHLNWLVDRSPRDLNIIRNSLLVATLPGLFGEYRIYMRAIYREPWELPVLPMHLAVAAALDETAKG
jgi:hypothetical protein